MKIYLIGMPGSGKSTLGKKLARRLHLEFLDLDIYIEQEKEQSILSLINEKGEDHFREIEREALLDTRELDHIVISCGGGTPCFFNNIEWINEQGTSVFLDVPLSSLKQRLEEDTTRPLLGTTSLEDLHAKRISIYQQAKLTVQNWGELRNLFEVK